jgi:hypothetical protein
MFRYRVQLPQTELVLDLTSPGLFEAFQAWLENDDPQKPIKAGYRVSNPDGSHTMLNFRFVSNIIFTEVKGNEEPSTAFQAVQFKIIANQGWQRSPYYYSGGYKLAMRHIAGLWTANPSEGWYDGYGDRRIPHARPGYAVFGAPEGAVCARVGDGGQPFAMQRDIPFHTEGRTGNLQFVINDDLSAQYGKGLADNQGDVTVELVQYFRCRGALCCIAAARQDERRRHPPAPRGEGQTVLTHPVKPGLTAP